MSSYTIITDPLEILIHQDHNRRVEDLAKTHLPNVDKEPFKVCDYGLVHRAHDESYWYGSTLGLCLTNELGTDGGTLYVPTNNEWSITHSIFEMRTWFEMTMQAFDDLIHRRDFFAEAIRDPGENALFSGRWTFVMANVFAVIEKSLKTLWAMCHDNQRTTIRHDVHLIYDQLDQRSQIAFRDTLHNLRFLRYPEPCPTSTQIRQYLEWAASTYMDFRYFESGSQPDIQISNPAFGLRLGLGGIVTVHKLLLPNPR